MEAVRFELRKLARGYARAVGGARAARWHLVVLVAAILLAFVHRAIHPIAPFEHLAGAWLPALLAALGLYVLGPVLRACAALCVRPQERRFARDLDDRFAWRDATETALTLQPAEMDRPVPALLASQTAGRLRDVKPRQLARVKRPRRWPRRILAFLFAAVLLLPGVDGMLDLRGGGTTGDGWLGSEGPDDPVGAPRPMKADFWLQTFVENPLKVEPLPGAGQSPAPGRADGQDAKQDQGGADRKKGTEGGK